jgi:arsenite-transporting ATPase
MVDYIRELYDQGRYEAIIWDTAPLGQTLELLHMPSMLRQHLRGAPRIYSKLRLGTISKKSILDIIRNWETISQRDIKFLQDKVSFILVTIPETLAVEQLDEVFSELGKYNLPVNTMLINNMLGDETPEFFKHKLTLHRNFIRLLHKKYSNIDIIELPMLPQEITGIERLKQFGRYITL